MLDTTGPDWTAKTQAFAAVFQALAAAAALWASYRLAKQSHRDAIERDRMAVERAEKDQAQAQRISLEHWIGLLNRAREVLREVQERCRDGHGHSAYFRSAQANLQVIVDLMERRAMDSLVEYAVLKHVTAGIAAVQGAITHLHELVTRADFLPQAQTHYLTYVNGIPEQLDVCLAELEKRIPQ